MSMTLPFGLLTIGNQINHPKSSIITVVCTIIDFHRHLCASFLILGLALFTLFSGQFPRLPQYFIIMPPRAVRDSRSVPPSLQQFRSLIVPREFALSQIPTFAGISSIELSDLRTATVEVTRIRQLLVDTLKMNFIYDPLIENLEESKMESNIVSLREVVRMLWQGSFYRFLKNNESQLKILVNNRTTQANVRIVVAVLLVNALKRVGVQEIAEIIMIFTLEAALYNHQQLYIPPDASKVQKVLKKLERIIKPIEFRSWLDAVKEHPSYNGVIEMHHVVYLCALTERKFINGFPAMMFKPKSQSFFKSVEAGLKEQQERGANAHSKENMEERITVQGLSFVEKSGHIRNLSKELMKQYRLRNPSKYKRPETADIRRRISSSLSNIGPKQPRPSVTVKFEYEKPKQVSYSRKSFANPGKRRLRLRTGGELFNQ